MSEWTLGYPVYSLDKQMLLPAGTTLSEEDLHALISSGRADDQQKPPSCNSERLEKTSCILLGSLPVMRSSVMRMILLKLFN